MSSPNLNPQIHPDTMLAKHKSVVTNYIFRWTDAKEPKVALFHRSAHENVHSYQGFYAPISGTIEDSDANSMTAAERELVAETGLVSGRDVEFAFAGKPFSEQDPTIDRKWTVHPYAWNLIADDSAIELSVEHDGWKWFEPCSILMRELKEQCVPALHISLQRVYFGPDGLFRCGDWLVGRDSEGQNAFSDTIRSLKNNKTDGARVLATDALKGLRDLAESFKRSILEKESSNEYWHALRVASYHFIYSARPSMNAAIGTAILRALSEISTKVEDDLLNPDDAIAVLDRHIEIRNAVAQKLSDAFTDFMASELKRISGALKRSASGDAKHPRNLELDIITLSASSTVREALKRALVQTMVPNLSITLSVLESRPGFEGASMAASLVEELDKADDQNDFKNRLRVRIVPESHAGILLQPRADNEYSVMRVILLGADRITPGGHVVNKAGSAVLAQLAHNSDTPNTKVVILSEEDKIAGPDLQMVDRFAEFVTNNDIDKLSEDDDYEFEMLKHKEIDAMRYEHHEPSEIFDAWPEHVKDKIQPYLTSNSSKSIKLSVGNIYFEPIQSKYIDVFLGENGQMTRRHILKTSHERTLVENAMFEHLYE